MKKVSDIRKEYMKERKRIKSYYQYLKNKGYVEFPSIPNVDVIPKRITRKIVDELKFFTSIRIKNRSTLLIKETGALKTGKEIRKERLLKPRKTKSIKTLTIPSQIDIEFYNAIHELKELRKDVVKEIDSIINQIKKTNHKSYKEIIIELWKKGYFPSWDNISDWDMVIARLYSMVNDGIDVDNLSSIIEASAFENDYDNEEGVWIR